jgi:hypothetical protein
MVSRVHSGALTGIDGYLVEVEVIVGFFEKN